MKIHFSLLHILHFILICCVRYLQHVVDEVEFDDRLSSDQVVHHGVIDVMHHGEAQHQDQTLQHVTHLRWLQQPRPTDTHIHTHTQLMNIKTHLTNLSEHCNTDLHAEMYMPHMHTRQPAIEYLK